MIRLADFSELMLSTGESTATLYVFDDDDSCDSFCRGDESIDVLFTLHSELKTDVYLKDEYCNANVCWFSAIGRDKVAAVIDKERQGR